jgi:predicted DNA-binding ribbon-helix-helix protein
MRVPLGGFGSKLNAMHRWHEARGIRAIHSTGRRDENNRDIIRWCFADPVAAKEFTEAFADMIGKWPPSYLRRSKRRCGNLLASSSHCSTRLRTNILASANHGTMLRELQVCSKEDAMKSSVIKRSVMVGGHHTSISLEDEFWSGLKEIAQAQGASLAQILTEIDTTRQQKNLSSAIRLFVLGHVHDQKMRAAFKAGL